MNKTATGRSPLVTLVCARRVADMASSDGLDPEACHARRTCNHLGAVLADSVLQAGLNYASVVRPRVERILSTFADDQTSEKLMQIVARGEAGRFLNWQHHTKISRFEDLVRTVSSAGIEDVHGLRANLLKETFCSSIQQVNGVGPKTVDYMSCLVGIESIAVDRHIKSYAKKAGVETSDYHHLKRVFCYAADLLEISRRGFDSWVWQRESGNRAIQLNLGLF